MNTGIRGRKQWHHPKATYYQYRMKRKPTRSERRFDDILDAALKDTNLSEYKATQVKYSPHQRKKRKFKKQRIFEDQRYKKAYIVDFYIPELKLAIEIDGSSHNSQQTYDAVRTSFLATRGIKVIRYQNEETKDFDTLKKRVQDDVSERMNTLKHRRKPKYVPEKERPLQPEIDLNTLTKQYLDNGGNITKCPTKAA